MKFFTFIACAYAAALWTAGALFGLADDELFFHSDPFSRTYFIAALGFLFLPAVMLLIGGVALVARRVGPMRVVASIPVTLVLAGLAVFGGEWLLEWGLWSIDSFWLYLACLAAAIALSAILVWCLPDLDVVLARSALLSRIVLLIALPATLAAGTYYHLDNRATASAAPRHVVMVLVDAMPSWLMSTYTPDTRETELDRVARRGCVIDHAYTSRTYTSGYFSVFYTGDLGGEKRESLPDLPRAIEQGDAGFRWISFHSNGFPESAGVTDYSGLRSAQLSERWAWLPRLLGLHYHVFLTWDDTRRYMGGRVNTLYTMLNGHTDEDAFWRDVLPQQIGEMASRYQRSFLLVHVSTSKHTVQALADGSYGEHAQDFAALTDYAKEHDYTYRPDQEPIVRQFHDYYRRRIDEYGRRVGRLLDVLDRTGHSRDTLVVVTADHGTTLHDGKVWYGPHSDEQTSRVPLFLFGNVKPNCPTPALVDTLDLRATIENYLGLSADTEPVGRDLLASPETWANARRTVPVLTVPSPHRKTWFLELHTEPTVRYVFNLHPEGDGRAMKGLVRGYGVDDKPISNDPTVWRKLAKALKFYRIQPEAIHAGLRARMAKHLEAQPH